MLQAVTEEWFDHVSANVFNNIAILLRLPAYKIGEEPQNADTILFFHASS